MRFTIASMLVSRAFRRLLNGGKFVGAAMTAVVAFGVVPARAEIVVPGTGTLITDVGDDFEDPNWKYSTNDPKSSRNIDKKERGPLGRSDNGRWLEGPHRGTPDVLRRVETPEGGPAGSKGALLIQTRDTGIPGRPSYKPEQDDIMVVVKDRLKRSIPPAWRPNCTVHVYLPPFDEWEKRSGSHLGFRMDCWGSKPGSNTIEQYWPGMFINLRSSSDRRNKEDSAWISMRANTNGNDVRGPEVKELGWWTLGMSVSPDGQVHYFAKPGLEELTREDHIGSYYCYNFRVQRFDLFFFNVVTNDNTKTWSTPMIIDDPKFYCDAPVALKMPEPQQNRRRR